MKYIFILAASVLVLVFACGNNTSKEQTSPEEKHYTRHLTQFSPEEIAYNDSIKDLPMDYTIIYEEIYTNDKDNNCEQIKFRGSQEEAYLESYSWLLTGVLNQVSSRVRFEKKSDRNIIIRSNVKLLDKFGKDIIPLISFPDRKLKSDSLWNKMIDFRKKEGIIGEIEMYKQPMIDIGSPMVLEMNNDLLK